MTMNHHVLIPDSGRTQKVGPVSSLNGGYCYIRSYEMLLLREGRKSMSSGVGCDPIPIERQYPSWGTKRFPDLFLGLFFSPIGVAECGLLHMRQICRMSPWMIPGGNID